MIPRKHIASLEEAKPEEFALLGHVIEMAQAVARKEGIVAGYRVVINNGRGAGQTVFHIHVHLLGGRLFRWPPG